MMTLSAIHLHFLNKEKLILNKSAPISFIDSDFPNLHNIIIYYAIHFTELGYPNRGWYQLLKTNYELYTAQYSPNRLMTTTFIATYVIRELVLEWNYDTNLFFVDVVEVYRYEMRILFSFHKYYDIDLITLYRILINKSLLRII